MNNGNGFILLHKSLEKHWISSNAEYFKAWVFMLFNACYEPYKVLCKGQLIPVEVGEIALSYDGWIKKLGNQWSLQKIRTFFDLLENDKMVTRSEGYKITKLSIVNFKTYQTEQHLNNKVKVKKITGTQQVDNKQVTTIEIKETNIKQKKEDKKATSVEIAYPNWFDDNLKSIFQEYLAIRKKIKLSNSQMVLTRLFGKLELFSGKNKLKANDVLLNAINSSWKDLYALKDSNSNEIIPGMNPKIKENYDYSHIKENIKQWRDHKPNDWKKIIVADLCRIYNKDIFPLVDSVKHLKNIDDPEVYFNLILEV